ncbi:MAG: flagellar assembly protein FliW [Ignavibacterium sp.]
MKIRTLKFDEFEFTDDKILHFDEGLIGFENLKRYLLINEENSFFYWLTSVDEPEIVFPLFPIRPLFDDYYKMENYEPFGVVKLNKDISKISINLKSPVYLNQNERKGFQRIIDNDSFPFDYKLFKDE